MAFKMIKNLNGKTVCSWIGLCTKGKLEKVSVPEIPAHDLKDTCSMCTVFADEFLQYIQSESVQNMVKEGAEEICQIFPGIVSCVYKVDNIVDKMFVRINELEGKDLCGMFGMCGGVAIWEDFGMDKSCVSCEYSVDLFLNIIRADADFERLTREAVEDLCSMSSVPECTEILSGYADVMLNWIKNMDGNTFCKLVAFCPSDLSLQDIQEILCPECKSLVNIILKELLIPSNWALIEFSLEEACMVLPIPKCKSKIHEILEKIHDYIKGTNGTVICTEIGLCSGRSCGGVGGVCSECTWVTKEIIALVTNNEIDGIVKSLLETFCAIIPIQGCANIADSFVDMIVDEIKKQDPKTLCGYIGLC